MGIKRFTYLIFSVFVFLAVSTSCQKDDSVKNNDVATLTTDSTKVGTLVAAPGNFLALSGTLTVKIKDSTYTFNAATDSIAFINVHTDGGTHYFGITAINKAHTLSFGISSSGFVNSNTVNDVAGSQFLLNADKSSSLAYSLSRYTPQKDSGSISIDAYNQGIQLAKGSFFTYLAPDDKMTTPYEKAEGVFDLKLK